MHAKINFRLDPEVSFLLLLLIVALLGPFLSQNAQRLAFCATFTHLPGLERSPEPSQSRAAVGGEAEQSEEDLRGHEGVAAWEDAVAFQVAGEFHGVEAAIGEPESRLRQPGQDLSNRESRP